MQTGRLGEAVLLLLLLNPTDRKAPRIVEFRNWMAAENAEEGVTKVAGLAGLNGLVLRLIAGVLEEWAC